MEGAGYKVWGEGGLIKEPLSLFSPSLSGGINLELHVLAGSLPLAYTPSMYVIAERLSTRQVILQCRLESLYTCQSHLGMQSRGYGTYGISVKMVPVARDTAAVFTLWGRNSQKTEQVY